MRALGWAAVVGAVSLPAGVAGATPRSAPAVELHLADGTPVALSALAGKVVLVDFWASWCAPCKASFPALDALYRDLHAQGLEVVAVNVDEDRRAAEEFLAGHRYEMPVAFDPKGVAPQAFGVAGMPASFLIDRQGRIRFSHMGYTQKTLSVYREEIAALLREAP